MACRAYVSYLLMWVSFMPIGRSLFAEEQGTMPNGNEDTLKAAYLQQLARIDALGKARDLRALEQMGDEIERQRDQWPGEQYYRLMSKLCDEIRSWVHVDGRAQTLLEQRYARLALARTGDVPLDVELNLLRHLQQDLEYRSGGGGAAWVTQRREKTKLWLRGWARLQSEIDGDFDFSDVPESNVVPPLGVNLPAGVAPEEIKDPDLRAVYEAAIAKNREKAEKYNWQHGLRNLDRKFSPRAERYLVTAYSREPFNTMELVTLLNEYEVEKDTRTRILDAVAKKMNRQQED